MGRQQPGCYYRSVMSKRELHELRVLLKEAAANLRRAEGLRQDIERHLDTVAHRVIDIGERRRQRQRHQQREQSA
jgi:hypothetical protein